MQSVKISHLILMNMGKIYNFTFQVKENTDSLSESSSLRSEITYDSDNFPNLTFSHPYNFDYVTFGVKSLDTTIDVDGFLKSFSPIVWLCMFTVIILCSLLLFSLSYSFQEEEFKLSIFDSVSFIVTNLIGEGHGVKLEESHIRIFASLWLLMGFVISNMYQSSLVANLLDFKLESGPETLEDLVNWDYKIVVPRLEHSNIVGFLEDSGTVILKQLVDKIETVKDKHQCLDIVKAEDKHACVAYNGYVTI